MLEFLAFLALQTAPLPCLQAGDRIAGELRIVETRHPNGDTMTSPFLVMVQSRCVEDADYGRAEGRWVQIAGDAVRAVREIPPGSTIIIVVTDFLVPHTAWHFGDFVALETQLVGYELQ
jgi:hypothetical protein